MPLRLYNTLTRSLQPFEPLEPSRKQVGIYVCGPTVYDDPHIGHARSAFVFDVLCRYLRSKNFQVTFVRNVTDVDDKIIEKARQELATSNQRPATVDLKAKCREVAERCLKSYHETMDRLGIERPTEEPRATEHIDEMLDLISKLVMNKDAYEAGGDVYFSVRKFAGYGKLSNRSLDELVAGARVEPGEHKEDSLDFALWKAAKPGEPSWKSPWGEGRPGWHIECSAMSTKYLGHAFDIHGGGVDLVFPHHENEIAQAQAAGKPFAKHWIHNGLLTVNGEKMSKSLGNFITVDQALKDAGHVDALKMFFLGTHYRSPLDYTERNVEAAAKRWDRLWHFLSQVERAREAAHGASSKLPQEVRQVQDEFEQVLDDDLNTPRALAVLDRLAEIGFQWVGSWDKEAEPRALRDQILSAGDMMRKLGGVLGLMFRQADFTTGPAGPSAEDKNLLEEYKRARKAKDFSKSDRLRKQLIEKGFAVQDRGDDSILMPRR